MPPKRNRKNSESPTAGAMADCLLPLDIMLCILTRLPVKSIHRFKSVCKPLRDIFSSPKFAKMHLAQFPQNPENQSVLIWARTAEYEIAISLLKIKSDEEERPIKLHIPFPKKTCIAEFVGCCNGLLCMAFPEDQLIALWNPALNNMFKFIPLSELEIRDTQMLSLGFGYDEEADDFKVIIIVKLEKIDRISLKVYSANSNSWSTIDVGFQFNMLCSTKAAIVNGNPYWGVAMVDMEWVSMCFDVRKMVFKIVPLPDLFFDYEEIEDIQETEDILLVDLKGDLGALVRKKKNGERVDVWVLDDDVGWTKNRSFRPPLKVRKLLQCLRNGKILVGESSEFGDIFVLDTENGGVKEPLIDGVRDFEVNGYTESLAYIKGMKQYNFYD